MESLAPEVRQRDAKGASNDEGRVGKTCRDNGQELPTRAAPG